MFCSVPFLCCFVFKVQLKRGLNIITNPVLKILLELTRPIRFSKYKPCTFERSLTIKTMWASHCIMWSRLLLHRKWIIIIQSCWKAEFFFIKTPQCSCFTSLAPFRSCYIETQTKMSLHFFAIFHLVPWHLIPSQNELQHLIFHFIIRLALVILVELVWKHLLRLQ